MRSHKDRQAACLQLFGRPGLQGEGAEGGGDAFHVAPRPLLVRQQLVAGDQHVLQGSDHNQSLTQAKQPLRTVAILTAASADIHRVSAAKRDTRPLTWNTQGCLISS